MNYPDWEQIKNLDKTRIRHFTMWECETLDVAGIITLFEEDEYTDPDYMIYFDVWENGYTDKNDMTVHGAFTKESYEKICEHGNKCRDKLIAELLEDRSGEWDFE